MYNWQLRLVRLATLIIILATASIIVQAQQYNFYRCPAQLTITAAELASLGIRSDPYCFLIPANVRVELTAEPQESANAAANVVVLVPGNGPKGYSAVTLKPLATDINSRRVVFTSTTDFQLLVEFKVGQAIYKTTGDFGHAIRTEADVKINSYAQSLRFRWPAPASNPIPQQPGQTPGNIRFTLLGIRADKVTDSFLTGDEDELYVRVYRGLGINERYARQTELGDIRAGQTITPNRVVYDGPAILVNIPYVSLELWDEDDSSNDDRIGSVTVSVENGQLSWSNGGFEEVEASGQFAGARRYHLGGAGSNYKVWVRAELY